MLQKSFVGIFFLFFSILIAKSELMPSNINTNNIDGFSQNNGQIVDQYGNKRADVLYLFDNHNFKCQLKYNGFSYEAYRVEVKENKTSMYNRKNLPDFARINKTVTYHSHRIDIRLEGANPFPEINSYGKSDDYINYYNANTGNEGVTDVFSYKKIVYKDIYPNIDYVFYVKENNDNTFGNGKDYLKYDIIVRPGGNVEDIQMIYEGADEMLLNPNAGLSVSTSQGSIIEQMPYAYVTTEQSNPNTANGEKVYAEFQLKPHNKVSFFIADYDKSKTLVIDPEIVWGTYFGDVEYDVVNKITHDELGNILATGETVSTSNIATSGAYQTTYGGGSVDAFLIKISKQGQRLWATYYGGSGRDVGYGVSADVVWHSVYIMGTTNSTSGISTEGAHQENYGMGYSDAFLAKFDLMGHRQWGTYYGGADAHEVMGGEYLYDAAIDTRFGDIYITGVVSSRDSIVTQYAHQEQLGGDFDAVLAKFTSDGELDWATYYGGTDFDGAYGITLDPSGYITIGGYTASPNTNGDDEEVIATTGAYQTSKSGNSDAFIARFNLRGTRQWGTYFGGPNAEIVNAATADEYKNIYIAGHTGSSSGIASAGAHQTTKNASNDGFIAKFSSTGQRLWSTYYGGERLDEINTITSNSNGEIAIGGYTTSTTNIASPDGFIDHYIGAEYVIDDGEGELTVILEDGFIALFDTLGTRQWGTYFGDDSLDYINDIDYDLNHNLAVCGKTESVQNLGTAGTYKPNYSDLTDGFIVKFGEFMRIVNISTPFCVGNPITISYETGTDLNSGNIFTAQLSDSSGDFSNPIDIGTKSAVDDGDIEAVIPSNTPPGTHFRIRIVSSNPIKTSKDNAYDITINPLPTPSITGDSPVCSRASYTYSVEADENMSNLWSVENATIIGDSTLDYVVIRWNDEDNGSVKVIQTNTNTNCVDSVTNDIEINITPTPNILGETEVISYTDELYRMPNSSKLSYLWKIEGGTLQGDSTTSQILVSWGSVGSGSVQLIVTNTETNCIDSLTLAIAINSSPVKISGKKTVCANSLENYSVENDETLTYQWETSGGIVQGSSTDTLVSILWGSPGNGIINLIRTNTGNQQVDTVITNIVILKLPEIGILGLPELCEGTDEFYYSLNTDSVENNWTVYNGTILGSSISDTVYIHWNNIEAGNDSTLVKASVTLEQTSLKTGCSNIKTKIINVSSTPSAEIDGDTTVCENDVQNYYSVDFTKGMINDWIVAGGTIIGSASDSTLQVEWGAVGKGSIKLIQTSTTLCSDSNTIEIAIIAIPEKPTIKQTGKILVSSSEDGNQWFSNNEKIESATGKNYSPDSSGYYTVQVTNANGCISEMSKPYYFDINSVVDFISSAKLLSLYPNPTDGLIHLELNIEGINPATIQLRNVIGNIVYEFQTNNLNKSIDKTIDISKVPSGIYILQIRVGDNIYNYKVIKL